MKNTLCNVYMHFHWPNVRSISDKNSFILSSFNKKGWNFLALGVLLHACCTQGFLLRITLPLALCAKMKESYFTVRFACAERGRAERRRENFLIYRPEQKLSKMQYNVEFISSIRHIWKWANWCSKIWLHMRS